VVDFLRFTLPAFVFSVGMSPVLAVAVQEGIKILRNEPWRVTRVRENSRLFLEQAKIHGLDVGPAIGAGVVSVLFSHQHECMSAARGLLEAGYFAPPILQLAVPKDKPRIRFFISAAHTEAQVSGVVAALSDALDSMRSGKLQRRSRQATEMWPQAASDERVAFETW
ncbi:MAG TPA: aminotransferase class I/II-fold pyridoxal phosphate-dependent enzyme, partial [Xanthobacteraceae bacterium]|nr:aminotransferase class I/II-fold pyridoxal phosphate-dependent enzyme [Xanthobacteraceae bacterium]